MDESLLKKYNSLPPDQQQTVNDFIGFLCAKHRKKSILETVCGMGFKDGYEFAALRMFGISNNCKLEEEKTVIPVAEVDRELAKLGLSMPAYLDKELLPYLKQILAEERAEVAAFEQKYQMTWAEMDVKFHDLKQFDLLEREDDYMDWITYIDFVESTQNTLKKHYDGADQ